MSQHCTGSNEDEQVCKTARLLLLSLPIVLALIHVGAACAEPPNEIVPRTIPNMPSGWVYIPKEVIDTVPGAFHDEVSGLLLMSEVAGIPGVVRSSAEWALGKGRTQERDVVNGIDLLLVRRKKAGCEEVYVTAYLHPSTGATWNVEGLVCDARALDRMKALVRAIATPELASILAPRSAESDKIGEADMAKLRAGMAWSAVRQFGVPIAIESVSDGGMVLEYFDGRADHRGEKVRLFFSRTHSLVRWERQEK